ncbi:MAG TPA: hypothetical protein VGJ86_25825, partial [Acidimicrobiales bacterium]
MEFGGTAVGDNEAEQPAGLHGAELAVVPDEDQLGIGRLDHIDQLRQVGGGDHGRFIDHDHLPGTKTTGRISVVFGVVEE